MTKEIILVAKEAQQQIGETSGLWLERYENRCMPNE